MKAVAKTSDVQMVASNLQTTASGIGHSTWFKGNSFRCGSANKLVERAIEQDDQG